MISLEYIDVFKEFYTEHRHLVDEHYKGFFKEKAEPSLSMFQKLIDMGAMAAFKILDEDKCVGYISLSISPSAAVKDRIDFLVDHVFLDKKARGKGVFEKALSLLEEDLEAEGVEKYTIAFPATKGHEALAGKLGFKKTTVLYTKSLGE